MSATLIVMNRHAVGTKGWSTPKQGVAEMFSQGRTHPRWLRSRLETLFILRVLPKTRPPAIRRLPDLLHLRLQHGDVLVFLRRQLLAKLLFQALWQSGGELAEVVARAAFHLQRRLVKAQDAGLVRHRQIAEEPVREQLFGIGRHLRDRGVQVGMILFAQLVQVVQFGLVEALQHQAVLRFGGPFARQLVKVEGVQLELHGIADGVQPHRVAQLAAFHHGQIAPAQETLAIGQRESGRELVALFAFPGVADLCAADLVLVQYAMTLGTGRRHYTLPIGVPTGIPSGSGSAAATPMYSSMPWPARRPAPMARITVAAPVTMSPPANTPGMEVMPVRSSVSM